MSAAVPPVDKSVPPPQAKSPRGLRIYTWPKAIYLYPSAIVSFICGIVMLFYKVDDPLQRALTETEHDAAVSRATGQVPTDAPPAQGTVTTTTTKTTPEGSTTTAQESAPITAEQRLKFYQIANLCGVFFLGMLGLNILIMALDFPRFSFVTIGLLVLCIFLLLVALFEAGFNIKGFFRFVFGGLYTGANSSFYFVYTAIYTFVLFMMWITRPLDYWEIRPNEILHHHGPLSDLERYPTINLKFDKEIPDIFEYILAKAGRLVLTIPGESRAVVLDNVMRINSKEEQLKTLMGRLKVAVGDSG